MIASLLGREKEPISSLAWAVSKGHKSILLLRFSGSLVYYTLLLGAIESALNRVRWLSRGCRCQLSDSVANTNTTANAAAAAAAAVGHQRD